MLGSNPTHQAHKSLLSLLFCRFSLGRYLNCVCIKFAISFSSTIPYWFPCYFSSQLQNKSDVWDSVSMGFKPPEAETAARGAALIISCHLSGLSVSSINKLAIA